MRRKISQASLVSASLIFAISFWPACSAPADIQLIINGGFETGDFTGWNQPAINPNPWSFVAINPFDGKFAACNPSQDTAIAETTLYQSIAPTLVNNITSAGFWYYNQGGPGFVGIATELTFSTGTGVEVALSADNPAYQQNKWAYFNLEPVLLDYSGEYLLQIGFYPKLLGSQEIDDVSITAAATAPVPDHPDLLFDLVCIGIGGLFCWRSRENSIKSRLRYPNLG